MKFNIKGMKTAPSGTNLCESCESAQIMQGHMQSQSVMWCSAMRRKVGWKVTECSSYTNKSLPSLYEMRNMAWILEHRKGGQIGFLRAKDLIKRDGWSSLHEDDE